MIEKDMKISCDGRVLASHTLIPETTKEKMHGMRGRPVRADTVMLFIFSRSDLLIFNMWAVREPLGIIVLDRDKRVVHAGVMRPWIGGYLGFGKYVIEAVPEAVLGVKKGEIISFCPGPAELARSPAGQN